ncbi:MAG: hypothetical protein IIW40_05350, partial [Clostridia bacterium]|nr:hypothetical protein [Clostridia bacterium]
MKKLCSLLMAVVLLLSMAATFSFSAAAASLPDKVEYNGIEYYDVTKKDDYYNVVQYAFDNLLEHVNVCINKNSPDYDRNYTNDVRNFTGIQTVTIFDYAGYSPNTVCFTDTKNTPEYAYGTIDIEFSDSAEELKKADDIIDRDLAGIKGKSVKDKVRYVADYVCSKAEYGSKKMPDGGYDLINGVYEALSGIRTNTVCATYAMTFQYIMERLGIDSRLICNGYHAWNIVKIDNYWYGVDCTMDAGQTIEPSALLMSGDHMKSSYATDRKDWYSAVKKQFQLAPTAAATTAKPTTAKPSTKPNTTVKQPTGTTTTTTEVTTATTETESTTDTVDTSAPSAPAITVKADSEPIKADIFQTAKESQTALKIEGE